MYYRGYGVPKDLATARAWLQQAAVRGSAQAKELLVNLDAAGASVQNTAAESGVAVRPTRLQ
jgi:TPR repeat protein